MDWQPIETAPLDRPVLVSDGQFVTVAWWDATFEWDRSAWTDGTVASWRFEENVELHPTHWMPLPAPPTQQS